MQQTERYIYDYCGSIQYLRHVLKLHSIECVISRINHIYLCKYDKTGLRFEIRLSNKQIIAFPNSALSRSDLSSNFDSILFDKTCTCQVEFIPIVGSRDELVNLINQLIN